MAKMARGRSQRLWATVVAAVALSPAGAALADNAALKSLTDRFLASEHCRDGAAVVGVIANGVDSMLTDGQVASHAGVRREIRATDEFEIGSITKTFTAMIYAIALAEGKVKPDTPAQSLMPEGVVLPVYRGAAGKETPITLDSLARHSSGLPRDTFEGGARFARGGLSREQMIASLRTAELQFEPGGKFLYSNLGFAVLGLAMEKLYGADIESLIVQKVAAPLRMSNTIFDLGSAPPESVLDGFRPNGAPAPEHPPTAPAFDSAVGLRSTPADMMTYLRFNMRLAAAEKFENLLPALQQTKPLRGVQDGETREIGLAWQTATLPDGRRIFWKDGNVPGFRSFIGFTNAPAPVGAVVLTTQNGCKATKLGRCAIELLSHARADEYCSAPDVGGPGSRRGPGFESDQ